MLYKGEDIAWDPGTLEIGGNRLDDQGIFRQLNRLRLDRPHSLGIRRQEKSVGWPLRLWGLWTFSGTFQPGDPVQITDGPFRDMLAIFEGPTTPTQRVVQLGRGCGMRWGS